MMYICIYLKMQYNVGFPRDLPAWSNKWSISDISVFNLLMQQSGHQCKTAARNICQDIVLLATSPTGQRVCRAVGDVPIRCGTVI